MIFLLKFAVAAGIIYYLLASGTLDVAQMLTSFDISFFALGMALIILSLVVQSYRWKLILNTQGLRVSMADLVRWNFIGEFFALTSPGGIGGDVARAFYLVRHSSNAKTAALATIVLDRFLGMVALMVIGGIGAVPFILDRADHEAAIVGTATLALIFGLGALALTVILFSRLPGFVLRRFAKHTLVGRITDIWTAFRNNAGTVAAGLLLSIGSQFIYCLLFLLSAASLGIDLSVWISAVAMQGTLIANAAPLTPAGVGVGESAAAYLFGAFGVAGGAAIMLMVRLLLISLQLLGGVFYLCDKAPSALIRRLFARQNDD